MMYTSGLCTLLLIVLPSIVSSAPVPVNDGSLVTSGKSRPIQLPIRRRRIVERTGYTGSVGIGDLADLFYTVSLEVGNTSTAVNLDTGSSDLWVMSDACHTKACKQSKATPYSTSSLNLTGASVDLQYGDSTTGTHASGPVVKDTVGVAGLTMADQVFASINDTNNSAVQNGGAGIFGLGFPAQSFVQAAVVNHQFNSPPTTDAFVQSASTDGPLVSRLAMSGQIEQPMFTITLQRDTIDVGGNHGQITIGSLPTGVDNSSITWVPVRLYSPEEGGQLPPTFAPNEIYPLRWEVPLDAVYLDGQKLPESNETATTQVKSNTLSALIDTGNSILRGPQDVVNNILRSVSTGFAANPNAAATLPCATPHTLSFQFGGKMFPVDPRDFISQNQSGDATTCVANNIVATDAPSKGTLFSWSLGDTFLKSNLVVFYYGNLMNPSLDPPRIGFLSTVPADANAQLETAVQDAQKSGGVFESTADVAPTASTVISVSATSLSSSTPSPTQPAEAQAIPPQSSTPSPSASGTPKDRSSASYSIELSSSFWYPLVTSLYLLTYFHL